VGVASRRASAIEDVENDLASPNSGKPAFINGAKNAHLQALSPHRLGHGLGHEAEMGA